MNPECCAFFFFFFVFCCSSLLGGGGGGRAHCCFTSTETIRTVRDGEPRTITSTFTQLLSFGGKQCFPIEPLCMVAVNHQRFFTPRRRGRWVEGWVGGGVEIRLGVHEPRVVYFFFLGGGGGRENCFLF